MLWGIFISLMQASLSFFLVAEHAVGAIPAWQSGADSLVLNQGLKSQEQTSAFLVLLAACGGDSPATWSRHIALGVHSAVSMG